MRSEVEDRHIFLSYAAEDREVAREIAEILMSRDHVLGVLADVAMVFLSYTSIGGLK